MSVYNYPCQANETQTRKGKTMNKSHREEITKNVISHNVGSVDLAVGRFVWNNGNLYFSKRLGGQSKINSKHPKDKRQRFVGRKKIHSFDFSEIVGYHPAGSNLVFVDDESEIAKECFSGIRLCPVPFPPGTGLYQSTANVDKANFEAIFQTEER